MHINLYILLTKKKNAALFLSVVSIKAVIFNKGRLEGGEQEQLPSQRSGCDNFKNCHQRKCSSPMFVSFSFKLLNSL